MASPAEILTEARVQLIDHRRRAEILIEDTRLTVLMTRKLIQETQELMIWLDDLLV